MRPSLTAMSAPHPLLHSRHADWTHRSTSCSSRPSSRYWSTLAGHTVPRGCGVSSPKTFATLSEVVLFVLMRSQYPQPPMNMRLRMYA
jgi:hypothetical protein